MIRPWPVAALWLATACSEPAAEVRLVRLGGACGSTGDARTLFIRALGDDGEVTRTVSAGAASTLDDLPSVTRQLVIEVVGDNGVVRTVGKTAPLAYNELESGTEIPVAMAPLGAACPTESLITPRLGPAVARAGRYVLVVGGEGRDGQLISAELYDPDTDRFEPVVVPERLANGETFIGAVATTLGDGRAVLTGGPTGGYTVFDPRTKQLGSTIVLEPRVFHGAVAVGGNQLLVAGGCRGANDLSCNGVPVRSVFRLTVEGDRKEILGTLERDHVNPTMLFDPGGLGGNDDRPAATLIIGSGTAQGLPVETTDRFDPAAGAAVGVPGTFAAATALDSGAVLTGFGAGTLAASSASAVLPPLLTARPLEPRNLGPRLRGTSLTLLEDGTVLALGQSEADAPAAALYRPGQNRWEPMALPPAMGSLALHRAVRLDDGSVLIVGVGAMPATAPRQPAATAWRLRPSLLGPFAAAALAVLGDAPAELTPSDPTALAFDRATGRYELVGSRAGFSQWVLVGGPRLLDGRMTAVVRVPAVDPDADGDGEREARGLVLLSHFQSPADLVMTRLVPGQPVTMQRYANKAVTELCRGELLPATVAGTPATITMTVRGGGAVTVQVGESAVLTCTAPELLRGAWGMGVIGTGARVGIDTLSVER
jgi:hypothetical protein